MKSLLAWASRNNSEFVYVGMHACPDLFTENKGELPWQGLTWEHLSNGMTRWSFTDTSASTYVHSTCIHFENFTTASVVTRFRDGKPGFWSSTITRQALDFYIIKWVRSYGLKNCPSTREIVVDLPLGKFQLFFGDIPRLLLILR